MALGNNRDYTTRDRNARRNLAVLKARTTELESQGVPNASVQAALELRDGKLRKELRAWVCPILAHKRAMRIKNRG
jgi:hypothetical protein